MKTLREEAAGKLGQVGRLPRRDKTGDDNFEEPSPYVRALGSAKDRTAQARIRKRWDPNNQVRAQDFLLRNVSCVHLSITPCGESGEGILERMLTMFTSCREERTSVLWSHLHGSQVRAKGSITLGCRVQESHITKCEGKGKWEEDSHQGGWLETQTADERKATEKREGSV